MILQIIKRWSEWDFFTTWYNFKSVWQLLCLSGLSNSELVQPAALDQNQIAVWARRQSHPISFANRLGEQDIHLCIHRPDSSVSTAPAGTSRSSPVPAVTSQAGLRSVRFQTDGWSVDLSPLVHICRSSSRKTCRQADASLGSHALSGFYADMTSKVTDGNLFTCAITSVIVEGVHYGSLFWNKMLFSVFLSNLKKHNSSLLLPQQTLHSKLTYRKIKKCKIIN